jgi:DNA-directed RNA polymerase specialized sigma24 family protein
VNGLTDQQLLRDYAERQMEAAFGELVRRHVDLVYSAALRMVRDAHMAEDVTQGVFVALSRSAGQLTARLVLSGWLHRTTQNLAGRALERLRELLAKRGIVAGASGLVVVISANAVQAALAGTAVATVTTSTAATSTLAMTTLQRTLVATTLAVAIGVGSYEARQASRLRAQVRTLQQQRLPQPERSHDAALLSLQNQACLGRVWPPGAAYGTVEPG